MGRPTAQAQNTIDKLKAAGFKRREFRVTTTRKYIGRHPNTGIRSYEYGDVTIDLRADKERQLELAQAMADQGLHVLMYRNKNGQMGYPTILNAYWATPGLYLMDFGKTDEYGLAITRKL